MIRRPKLFNKLFLNILMFNCLYLASVAYAGEVQVNLSSKQYEPHEYIDLISIEQNKKYVKIVAKNVCVPVIFRIHNLLLKENMEVEWQWKIQASSYNINSKYDSFASISFIGKKGLFRHMILRYIWIADDSDIGSVYSSPYSSRTFWLTKQNRYSPKKTWIPERANLYNDFKTAFGRVPDKIIAISIFPDSNDTNEKFTSYYGPIVFH